MEAEHGHFWQCTQELDGGDNISFLQHSCGLEGDRRVSLQCRFSVLADGQDALTEFTAKWRVNASLSNSRKSLRLAEADH